MRLVQVLTFPAALPGLLSAGLRGLARVVDRSRPSRVGMVAIALVVALYLRRVRRAHLRLPVGADGESRSTLALARRCPTLFKHYFPFLLDNGTLQTMMAFLVRPLFLWLPKPTRHELVTTMDGGTLGLAWFEAPTLPSDAPLLIILPGNLGGYDAPYIRRMLYECRRIGWRVVVWQRRGADGLLLSNHIPQHYADAHGDFDLILQEIQRQYPLAPLLGLGYSLGANYLARHLAQAGQRAEKLGQARRARRGAAAPVPPCTPFLAGVCVANPFELVQGSYYLFYYSPIADWFLRTDLKLMVTRNKQQLERAVDLPTVMRSRSYRDMCAHFHQVVNGWEELDAMLDEASSGRVLRHVRTPLLCINAADDPCVHPAIIPYHEFGRNPYLALAVTGSGGHHAYIGWNPLTPSWCDRVTVEWLSAALEQRKERAQAAQNACARGAQADVVSPRGLRVASCESDASLGAAALLPLVDEVVEEEGDTDSELSPEVMRRPQASSLVAPP